MESALVFSICVPGVLVSRSRFLLLLSYFSLLLFCLKLDILSGIGIFPYRTSPRTAVILVAFFVPRRLIDATNSEILTDKILPSLAWLPLLSLTDFQLTKQKLLRDPMIRHSSEMA